MKALRWLIGDFPIRQITIVIGLVIGWYIGDAIFPEDKPDKPTYPIHVHDTATVSIRTREAIK